MLRELKYEVKLANVKELKKELEEINLELEKIYEKACGLKEKLEDLHLEVNGLNKSLGREDEEF